MKVSLGRNELNKALKEYIRKYYKTEVLNINYGDAERYIAITKADVELKKHKEVSIVED